MHFVNLMFIFIASIPAIMFINMFKKCEYCFIQKAIFDKNAGSSLTFCIISSQNSIRSKSSSDNFYHAPSKSWKDRIYFFVRILWTDILVTLLSDFATKDWKTIRDSLRFRLQISLLDFSRFLTRSSCSNRLIIRSIVDFDVLFYYFLF